jgi:hypothetical protein
MRTRQRGRELVQEADLYLSGHYAEYLDRRDRPVPSWAWLATLAHGDPEQLRSLMVPNLLCDGRRTRTTKWWQAVTFLAAEILVQHDDDRDIDDMRRSVLVPLELKWLAAGRAPQRPGQLVRTVLDALHQYQDSGSR